MKVRKYVPILHPQLYALKCSEPLCELKPFSHISFEVTVKTHLLLPSLNYFSACLYLIFVGFLFIIWFLNLCSSQSFYCD